MPSMADAEDVAGRSTDEALAAVEEVASIVHGAGGRCEVIIARRHDRHCHTIGTATPARVVALVGAGRAAAPNVPLGAHFHNTRGTGTCCGPEAGIANS